MDALDLIAKIKMDLSEYEEGLDKAKSSAESGGNKIANAFGTVAKAGLAGFMTAVTAAATGIGAITKKSVEAYAEYQQMEGGVKKLYGNMGLSLEDYAKSVGQTSDQVKEKYESLEKAQNLVLDNAKKAYQTSGMSMNQYMETATSFSAKLISDLGGDTVKAAEVTDTAMKAISDNFNTFGGDIGMIQGAFQGFAKGNYMMLDNLKLGYSGTKTEMERLIDDANEYAKSIGQAGDLTMDSFADQIQAIQLIQEKQQIAGTTQREAATTIEGSLNMTKAAWENLLTAMGDKEADLSTYISNLVSSVSTLAKNVMPVVKQALDGVGQLISELAPVVAKAIPTLISDTLPKLLKSGIDMVQAILDGIEQNIDVISQGAIEIAMMLVNSFMGMLPQLIEIGIQIATNLAMGLAQALPTMIPEIVNGILLIGQVIIDNLPLLLECGMQIILGLIQGIVQAIPLIIEMLPTLINSLINGLISFLPQMVEAWVKLMDCLEIALPQIIDAILAALPQLMDTIVGYFMGPGLKLTLKAGIAMFNALVKAVIQIGASLLASVGMLVRNAASTIAGEASYLLQAGQAWFGGLLSGVTNKISEIKTKVTEFLKTLGTSIYNTIKEKVDAAKNWGSDLINNFVSGLKAKWESVKGAVTEVANIIKRLLHFSEPDEGPLKDFHTYAPDMMNLFIKGINDNKNKLYNAVTDAFDFQESITSPEINMMATTTLKGEVAGTPTESSEPINLTVNVITELDSEVLNKKSYKYTLNQLGADTRALKVATGGY